MDFDIYKTCPRGTDLPANKTRENRLWSRRHVTVSMNLLVAVALIAVPGWIILLAVVIL